MRKLLVVVLFSFISLMAKSQNLTIEGTAPDIYITHIVAPKENFYSVSRFYNQAPKSIASFNKIEMEKGLTIGQQVKIPLTAQNFDVSESNADAARIPLTHVVAKSETLFRIGTNLHVAPELIRKWNNLSADNIAAGTSLIVGYLKTNHSQASVSAAKNTATPGAGNSEPKTSTNGVETKPNTGAAKKEDPLAAGDTTPKEKKDNITEKQDENMQGTKEPEKNVPDQNTAAAEKDTAIAVVPESTTAAPAKEEPAKQDGPSSAKDEEVKKINEPNANGSAVMGTFEEIYASRAQNKSENTKSGEAATFKSISGWQDKKYYVLVNNIAPGTIVKISSADKKAVYAKVLGSMPEMKENSGLLLRISNAAASSLGIIDPKFPVKISYY